MQTRGWLLLPACLGVAALLFIGATRTIAQEAIVRVDLPSAPVPPGGGSFTVSVLVEDVANLGAFEFNLSYDSAVLTAVNVAEGPFLGSSGRGVTCLSPRMTQGSVGLTCVTLGATPDGPTGSGVLATVTFEPAGPGTSPLHFVSLTLTDPPAQRLPAQAEDGTLTVAGAETAAPTGSGNAGFAWVLWGPIIGVAALALAALAAGIWRARRAGRT